MTLTIRDISEARQAEIEYLVWVKEGSRAHSILVAVAEQLELFERRYYEPTLDGRQDALRRAEHQVALQIWEAAYEAAGGVVRR